MRSIETEVIIHYKNGKKNVGLLSEGSDKNDSFLFVPSDSLINKGQFNTDRVEVIPGVLIESIECDLK